MEQCFTLATDYFSEGEVSEKRAYRAPSQPSLQRSSVRKRPSLCTEKLSNQWTVVTGHQFINTQTRSLLGLFAQ